MKLEFRNKRGEQLFLMKNEMAERMFINFMKLPEFVYTKKTFEKSGTFNTFECVKDCGYFLFQSIDMFFEKGDYIKVII